MKNLRVTATSISNIESCNERILTMKDYKERVSALNAFYEAYENKPETFKAQLTEIRNKEECDKEERAAAEALLVKKEAHPLIEDPCARPLAPRENIHVDISLPEQEAKEELGMLGLPVISGFSPAVYTGNEGKPVTASCSGGGCHNYETMKHDQENNAAFRAEATPSESMKSLFDEMLGSVLTPKFKPAPEIHPTFQAINNNAQYALKRMRLDLEDMKNRIDYHIKSIDLLMEK
jgi:hypothetical protein